jgi:hypothetical protein
MDVSSNVYIHGWAQQFGFRIIFDISLHPLPANLHPTPLPVRHPTRSLPATSHLQCVFFRGSSWWLRGSRAPAHRKQVKKCKKPRVRLRSEQGGSTNNACSYLVPLAFCSFQVGCCLESWLQCRSLRELPKQALSKLTAMNSDSGPQSHTLSGSTPTRSPLGSTPTRCNAWLAIHTSLRTCNSPTRGR